MPKNISFMLTTEQVRTRQKTVTRRLGWKDLKRGDVLDACVKCMGLKPGEKVERLATIRVLDVQRVPLWRITNDDVAREGFPGKSAEWFIEMFTREMKVKPSTEVTRIEFEYLEDFPALPITGEISGV